MIVLGAIGVLLILMLTAVGLLMYSAKAKPEAPLRSPCPDYWEFDGSGCRFNSGVNTGELLISTITAAPSPPSTPDNTSIYYVTTDDPAVHKVNPKSNKWSQLYPGMTADCAKGKWARDLGIVWDGYTNSTEC